MGAVETMEEFFEKLNAGDREGAVALMDEKTEMRVHVGDNGGVTDFHFCPLCGSTVWYQGGGMPELIAVAIGAFADPDFPAPYFSVWEQRKHAWVTITGDGVEHFD